MSQGRQYLVEEVALKAQQIAALADKLESKETYAEELHKELDRRTAVLTKAQKERLGLPSEG